MEENIHSDALKIKQLLPNCPKSIIIQLLKNKANDVDRVKSVTKELIITSERKGITPYEDAKYIIDVFPELNATKLIHDLHKIAWTPDRVKIVLKKHLLLQERVNKMNDVCIKTVSLDALPSTSKQLVDFNDTYTEQNSCTDPAVSSTSREQFVDFCNDDLVPMKANDKAIPSTSTEQFNSSDNEYLEQNFVADYAISSYLKKEAVDLNNTDVMQKNDTSITEYLFNLSDSPLLTIHDVVEPSEINPQSVFFDSIHDAVEPSKTIPETVFFDSKISENETFDDVDLEIRTSKEKHYFLTSSRPILKSNIRKRVEKNYFAIDNVVRKVPKMDDYDAVIVIDDKDYEETTDKDIISSDTELYNMFKSLDENRKSVETEEIRDNSNTAGPSNCQQLNIPKLDQKIVNKLLEIFSDADPQYVRDLCTTHCGSSIDTLIDNMVNLEYPRRSMKSPEQDMTDHEQQLEFLKEMFPDADVNYLQEKVEQLGPEEFKIFVTDCLEHKDYPTMKDYLRNQQISAQQRQYTTDFKVENFLDIIPEPNVFFKDPKRAPSITISSSPNEIYYVKWFLKNLFPKHRAKDIESILKKCNLHLIPTVELLRSTASSMVTKRKPYTLDSTSIKNIPLLQEIAWIEHRKEIEKFIMVKEEIKRNKFIVAKQKNLLLICGCCYDEEIMEEDSGTCKRGCVFCKSCIQKSAEVGIGDGKLDFPCLANCESTFSMHTLQFVLKPNIFSRMAQKKQLEEVKSAGLEDLEGCPFCDFATIPIPDDRVFKCLNPDCMKESCRSCHEPSHLPLRCDEIEKEDEVKKRTYLENKMTESLLRKCWKCGIKFIKHDGCNKMTCSCGAKMCYVCLKPVDDYSHFNGQGGDKFHLCPLFNDTQELHRQAVLQGVETAKADLGLDPNNLKHDPTKDLAYHYTEPKKNKVHHGQQRIAVRPVHQTHNPNAFGIPRIVQNDNGTL